MIPVRRWLRSFVCGIAFVMSAASAWSAVPGAPTAVTAIGGSSQAVVSFVAPSSNGGATITGYAVTASPGGVTATGSSSPLSVTGLTTGTAYTFIVAATNSAGTGIAPAPRGRQRL